MIVAGCSPRFGERCRLAVRSFRLRVSECTTTAIWTAAARQRPVGILMTHARYSMDPVGYEQLAAGLGARIVRIESEAIDDADVEAALASHGPPRRRRP